MTFIHYEFTGTNIFILVVILVVNSNQMKRMNQHSNGPKCILYNLVYLMQSRYVIKKGKQSEQFPSYIIALVTTANSSSR